MFILSFVSFDDIEEAFMSVFYTIFLLINSLIYDLVNFAYQVFLTLASAQIFTAEKYQEIASRIYAVIGVAALFLVAYALLRAIADPEGAAKSDMAAGKVITNLLKVIILIAFIPTIFNIAYNLQNVIISNQTIPKLILGDAFDSENSSASSQGVTLANEIYVDFLSPTSGNTKTSIQLDKGCKLGECDSIADNDGQDGVSYQDMIDAVEKQDKNFAIYANMGEAAAKGFLDFNFLMQVVCGIFMVYLFFSFCIDLGVRVVKLAYYQLIAPIPIMTLMIPSQKKIFDNWKNGTISTFLSVFIRLAIVMLGVYLIEAVPDAKDWELNLISESTPTVQVFAKVFVILGILMFMKQAPKLISDMFGLKEGSFKLGIGDKLREGGVIGAAGALGAVGGAVANKTLGNAKQFGNEWKAAKGKGVKAHVGAIAKGAGRTLNPGQLARFGSAGLHGYNATKDSKSFTEFGQGVQGAEADALTAPSMTTRIKDTASGFVNTTKGMINNRYTPVSGDLARYQKRIDTAKSVDILKNAQDFARSHDKATIEADRNLNNFNSGSMDLETAVQYSTGVNRIGLDANGNYTSNAANIVSYGYTDASGNSISEIQARDQVRSELKKQRDSAEEAYINAQMSRKGSELNISMQEASRGIRDDKADPLMNGVVDLESAGGSSNYYATMKSNHDTMFKEDNANSNINKLRGDPNYINAVVADRQNKAYQKQTTDKK